MEKVDHYCSSVYSVVKSQLKSVLALDHTGDGFEKLQMTTYEKFWMLRDEK